MSEDSKRYDEAKSFISSLGAGREAFHSEVTEYCLRISERSPEDFIRHFSPAAIMQALTSRPTERARIVSEATGVHEKVAHKMSPEASGEALQISLEEKVTTHADIVRLFQPDDRQRYLDRKALWAFDVEGEPWKATASSRSAYERAKAYIAYILDRGLANLLLSHEELVAAITVEKLAALLPREELGAIIAMALRQPDKFSEEHLVGAVPPRTLVDHVPLDYVWTRVVVPLIAERHEYVAGKPGLETPVPSFGTKYESSAEETWSLSPSPEASGGSSEAFPPGDADVVTVDDIIEEDPTVIGATAADITGKGKNRKSMRSA